MNNFKNQNPEVLVQDISMVEPSVSVSPGKYWLLDLFVSSLFAFVIALCNHAITSFEFHVLSGGANQFLALVISLLEFPLHSLSYLSGLLKLDSAVFVLGMGAELFAPIVAFLFYFAFFLVFLRTAQKLNFRKYITYGTPTIFVLIAIITITPYIYGDALPLLTIHKESGANEYLPKLSPDEQLSASSLEKCLTGETAPDPRFGRAGKDICFEARMGNLVALTSINAEGLIKACLSLSNKDIASPQTKIFPYVEPLTFREYCLNTLYSQIEIRTDSAFPNDERRPQGIINQYNREFLGELLSPRKVGYLNVWSDPATRGSFIQKQMCDTVERLTQGQDTAKRCQKYIATWFPLTGEEVREEALQAYYLHQPNEIVHTLKTPLAPDRTIPNGDPVWAEWLVDTNKNSDVNSINFELGFSGEEGSVGQLKVFIDDKEIAIINEQDVPVGVNRYFIPFDTIKIGTPFKVKFQVTPLVKEYRSGVDFETSNVAFGLVENTLLCDIGSDFCR